jgi:hypothetical protein
MGLEPINVAGERARVGEQHLTLRSEHRSATGVINNLTPNCPSRFASVWLTTD